MKKSILLFFALIFASSANAYDYKIKDSYVSTIFGTSKENKAQIKPAPFKFKSIDLGLDKDVPDVFWYSKKLKYLAAIQDHHAPLAFLIAGTGANHMSSKVKLMANILYQDGYSVVTLPSPSHSNFIISASQNSSVGGINQDVESLKYAIKKITLDLIEHDDAKITDYVVGGYSLGAAHSAFLSYSADNDKNYPIKFSKVLMVNAPYDILESAIKIDGMFDAYVGSSPENLAKFYHGLYSTIAETYDEFGGIEVGPEALLSAYKNKNINHDQVQGAIGTAFRFSSADMLFSIDVMRNMGVIVPKNKPVQEFEPLKDYYLSSLQYGFGNYAEHMLTKIYNKPLKTLSDETSLKAIEDYLKNSNKIVFIHNANDFILKDGDIEYFKSILGDRAKIFPYGGHCGNMDHKDNVQYIHQQFKLNNKGE